MLDEVRDGQWRFSGLEFRVLWEKFGRDRLPYPLHHRPSATTRDGLDRQWRAAAARCGPRVTEDLYGRLAVLAEPDTRIEVCGFARGDHPADVRMHAGIRGVRATLAVQLPGTDPDSGGDVLVRGMDAARLPAAIASTLPPVPAGAHDPVRFRRSDLHSERRGPVLSPAGTVGRRGQALAVLGRPRAGIGEITVFAGASYDRRPTGDGAGIHWIDVAGDGRYSLAEREDVVVAPASEPALAAEIERLIGRVRVHAVSH